MAEPHFVEAPESSTPAAQSRQAIDAAFTAEPAAPLVDAGTVSRRAEPSSSAAPNRWGVAALAAGVGTFRVDGSRGMAAAGRFGIGPRFSLVERNELGTQVLPSVAALVGVEYGGLARFFGELRMELLVASPGGLCQPGFTLFALTGLDLPVGAPVEGYVGAGLGWNWLPSGNGGGGSAVAAFLSGLANGGAGGVLLAVAGLILVPMVVAFVFAGRLELRYYPTMGLPNGPSLVTVTMGIGF